MNQTEQEKSRWLLAGMWFGTIAAGLWVGAGLGVAVFDMRIRWPISMMMAAFIFSIAHPGGWLMIAGLILTLIKRKAPWLWLAGIGAVLTGVTIPLIEGMGAMVM